MLDPRSNRGYIEIGREQVTQSDDADLINSLRANMPDRKETMEIGRDWDSTWKNLWPQEKDAPGFKPTMLSFYQACQLVFFFLSCEHDYFTIYNNWFELDMS